MYSIDEKFGDVQDRSKAKNFCIKKLLNNTGDMRFYIYLLKQGVLQGLELKVDPLGFLEFYPMVPHSVTPGDGLVRRYLIFSGNMCSQRWHQILL